MKLVRFHPEVEQELVEHEAWYRQRSEVAAQGFLLELDHAIAAVAEAPERCRPAGEANVGMCFLAFRSRFSIAFEEMRSSLRPWLIKVVVLAIGAIASSRGPTRRWSGLRPNDLLVCFAPAARRAEAAQL